VIEGFSALLPDETPLKRGEEGAEMVSELNTPKKVVGAKQAKRALNDCRATRLFLAEDADPRVTEPLQRLAFEKGVPVEKVPSMKELGTACGIAVGSAVAAIVR
jgi:large subunit ribosomal protein L7A